MSDVRLSSVRKVFGGVTAVGGVSLSIDRGEMVCFLGPSGCGKTTTLRMIAGLDRPDEGEIIIRGKAVNDLPTYKRNIGMVFQNYALFPHMTVKENIAFGLSMRKEPRSEIDRRVKEVMELIRLELLADRLPSQLSGGQRQRVALARAIVTKPDVLLLDEPLGALDKKLREQMQIEIRSLQQEVGITTVFVTHDQEEALTLSDRIVVMEAGRIVQVGTPQDIYEKPATPFVSDFIGVSNAFRGEVVGFADGFASVKLEGRELIVTAPHEGWAIAGQKVEVSIRPENLFLKHVPSNEFNCTSGTISNIIYTGAATYYHLLDKTGLRFVAVVINAKSEKPFVSMQKGEQISFGWPHDAGRMLPLAESVSTAE